MNEYIGDYVRKKYVKKHLVQGRGYCLDLGCGPGRYFETILEKGYVPVGIDIKREKIPNFILASATHLPFKDTSFSAVIMVDVLEHLKNDTEALREVHRVLKVGSMAVLHTPHWPQSHFFGDTSIHPDHARQGYGTTELKALIREAGFSKFKMEVTFRHFSALAWDLVHYRPSIYDIAKLDDEQNSWSKGGYGLLVVAKK